MSVRGRMARLALPGGGVAEEVREASLATGMSDVWQRRAYGRAASGRRGGGVGRLRARDECDGRVVTLRGSAGTDDRSESRGGCGGHVREASGRRGGGLGRLR